jgi:hypothetical protein
VAPKARDEKPVAAVGRPAPVSMPNMTDLPDRASESFADADAMIRVAER